MYVGYGEVRRFYPEGTGGPRKGFELRSAPDPINRLLFDLPADLMRNLDY